MDEKNIILYVQKSVEKDWLVIVEGGLNREAWRVDLGETSDVKSTPAIVDVNNDGIFEIILAN